MQNSVRSGPPLSRRRQDALTACATLVQHTTTGSTVSSFNTLYVTVVSNPFNSGVGPFNLAVKACGGEAVGYYHR